MMIRLFIFLLLFPVFLSAQRDHDDSIPVRIDFQLASSLKLAYENDLFTHTDEYYTGGTFIEVDLPVFRKNPVTKILVRLPLGIDEAFGISGENLGFTPRSIKADSILFGDRPFAGLLYLGFSRVSCNGKKQLRLTSKLNLGVIGPAAFGYEIQKYIHEHTNNPVPHGWQFQIGNDVMIDYNLKLEKGLLSKKIIDLTGYALVNAGTVYDHAGIGLKTRIGKMDPYFVHPAVYNNFQFWIFAGAEGRVIARDATLEGGLFNSESIYVIPSSNLKRATFLFSAGAVMTYKKIRLEYYNASVSPEYKNCWQHAWGHIGFEILF
jgi:lipid A 3-O-deacylase